MQQRCKRTQQVTSNNGGRCCPTMLRPFARTIKRKIRYCSRRSRAVTASVMLVQTFCFANQTFCFFAVLVAVAVAVAKAP